MQKQFLLFFVLIFSACSPQVTVTSDVTVTSTLLPTETPIPTATASLTPTPTLVVSEVEDCGAKKLKSGS